MLFRVAGSRAETHHGHLVKSRLECHHRSGLWPDLSDYFGLVSFTLLYLKMPVKLQMLRIIKINGHSW